MTPLEVACSLPQPMAEIIAHLLQAGATPNTQYGDQKMSPLHLLISNDPYSAAIPELGLTTHIAFPCLIGILS